MFFLNKYHVSENKDPLSNQEVTQYIRYDLNTSLGYDHHLHVSQFITSMIFSSYMAPSLVEFFG